MDIRWLLVPAAAALLAPAPSNGVAVRWAEGTVHGFLELRSQTGELLADGDLLQVPRDSDIESSLVFHFQDSSLFRETVTFTQHGVFRLESYHLVQTGKAFAADIDVTLSSSGNYTVTSSAHKDGKQQHYSGKLDLPGDVSNGLIPVIGKNVDRQHSQTVHVVAFTPKPIVIPLEFVPTTPEPGVVRFTLKPKLNLLQRVGAAIKHETPPDSYLWIVTKEVPVFVRFEGPMYAGPVWRVDQTSPRWSPDRPRT